MNLVTWAVDVDEYRRNADLVLGNLGLSVVGVENTELVSSRKEKAELSDDIEEMIKRAQHNPNAIIYGTFHTWKKGS